MAGGIRLYFGNGHDANIQELGWSSANPQNQWNAWYQFPDSIATSGVTCSTNGSSIINVYMTSSNNGNALTQWVFDYNYPVSTGWAKGMLPPPLPLPFSIIISTRLTLTCITKVSTYSQYTQTTPISSVNDGTTDTIYYQTRDGAFSRLRIDNSAFPPKYIGSEVADEQVGYNNTKIAAALLQGTTHLVVQAENSHVMDLVSGSGKSSALEIPIRG